MIYHNELTVPDLIKFNTKVIQYSNLFKIELF